jgi:hypothetical protein
VKVWFVMGIIGISSSPSLLSSDVLSCPRDGNGSQTSSGSNASSNFQRLFVVGVLRSLQMKQKLMKSALTTFLLRLSGVTFDKAVNKGGDHDASSDSFYLEVHV